MTRHNRSFEAEGRYAVTDTVASVVEHWSTRVAWRVVHAVRSQSAPLNEQKINMNASISKAVYTERSLLAKLYIPQPPLLQPPQSNKSLFLRSQLQICFTRIKKRNT